MIEQVRKGLTQLEAPPDIKAAAVGHLTTWLETDDFADYQPQLHWWIETGRFPELLDAFYQVLPFGTGGRRGAVGAGTNRFNGWTLATSVAGHVSFLRDRFAGETLRVVITYDTRQFHDVRGLYNPELPDPLRMIRSEDFAELAARVYTSAGVEVFMAPSGVAMATPELSFAIRRLEAHGGLNVSASHNPPDDNGGKFYDERGGQAVPPLDQEMVDRVAGVTRVEAKGVATLRHRIPDSVHAAYVELNAGLGISGSRRGRVVYTPLHGTGGRTVGAVLEHAGFSVVPVPAQAAPDGRFSSVPFGVANPEVPDSMDLAVEVATKAGIALVLSTDPDADRLGARALDTGGRYRFLTGNELGALVVDAVLARHAREGTMPAHPLVIRTEVTSDLVSRVAHAHGAAVVDDLLVGFKYVAAVLETLERDGEYRGIEATVGDFVAGVEESHGILLTPEIRDKDAAAPALVLAQLAAEAEAVGRSLPELLDDLYRRVGYVANRLTSVVMKGAAGQQAIAAIQDRLRRSPPTLIDGMRVVRFVDHWDEGPESRYGPIRSETDRASRNVLVFHLEGERRVIIRPSGTEPKNKTYVEVGSPPLAPEEDLGARRARVEEQARALEIAFVRHCLELIDVRLPGWGYRISGLVALEHKLDFTGAFLRELDERAATPGVAVASLRAWIEQRLRAYGRDALALTGEAFRAYLEEARSSARGDGERDRLARLDLAERAFFPDAAATPDGSEAPDSA